MYLSFGLLFACCLLFSLVLKKLHLPALIGYMIAGFLLGPGGFNLLTADFLDLSAFLRKFALIIILIRAGLGLNLQQLKENGLAAALLCFVPASFEIVGYLLLGFLLHFSLGESFVLGCVMAAVSPAVVVPRMLKLDQEGYGRNHGVCQTILAGASLDDIYVITLFTAAMALIQGDGFSLDLLLNLPLQILTGALAGAAAFALIRRFASHLLDLMKPLLLVTLSFLFIYMEELNRIPFSGLIAVFVMSAGLCEDSTWNEAKGEFNQIWNWASMLLFAFVGVFVNLSYFSAHLPVILLILLAGLAFRCLGVFLAVSPSGFTWKEKVFSAISYLPKATVQAGIGGLPLAAGLACGSLVLTFAAAAILITAPVGAFFMDTLASRLLSRN